jgi:hypothetical protein
MKTVLFLILLFLINSLPLCLPSKKNTYDFAACHKQKYIYVVETDLTAKVFSDAFNQRLITKYNWHKVSTDISGDDTFRNLFNFKDESENLWICEVTIKKVEPDKISVEINLDYLES